MSIMQNNILVKMPGYRQIEYTIILNPTEAIRERVHKIRNDFHSKFNTSFLLSGKPNIRLAKFLSFEMMEERLIDHLRTIAIGMPPFKAVLKDYGSFPSHTLFINVASKFPLQMLMKGLRSVRRLVKSSDPDPYFTNEFYIPVAVKLTPDQYDKGWRDFSNRQFTSSFIADSMLLLKRRVGEKNYQIAERFEFMNLPVSVKQGELFA